MSRLDAIRARLAAAQPNKRFKKGLRFANARDDVAYLLRLVEAGERVINAAKNAASKSLPVDVLWKEIEAYDAAREEESK